MLAVSAYRDLKDQTVYLYIPILAGIVGLVLHLINQEYTIIDILGGAGIGVAVLLIAWIGNECIGLGDGAMLTASGILLGFRENLALFMTALFLTALCAIFLLAGKRKGRKDRIPFLPFLLAAYLLLLI